MTSSEIQTLVVGLLQGLGMSSVFLLAVFIGFCVLVGFTKTRHIGKTSLVVRSLDDRLGSGDSIRKQEDVPRGPIDQLKTPELLEQSGRQ